MEKDAQAAKKELLSAPFKPVKVEWQTKYGKWGAAKTTEVIAKLDTKELEKLRKILIDRDALVSDYLLANVPPKTEVKLSAEWVRNSKAWVKFFDSALQTLDSLILESELKPLRGLYKEPPTNVADVLARVEKLRVNDLGQKEADKRKEESVRLCEDINKIAPLRIELERLETKISELKNQLHRLPIGVDRDKIGKELASAEKERDKTRADIRKYDQIERGNSSAWNRRTRLRQLTVLFPDRGGTPFFPDDLRKKTLATFKKRGMEDLAEDVFRIYDMIARTYNIGGKAITPPTSIKFVKSKKRSGCFKGWEGSIEITPDMSSHYTRQTLAHELGHWLEMWVLGSKRCAKNAEWLCAEQEYKPTGKENKVEDFRVPNKKQPNLCADTENYSQRYYSRLYITPTETGTSTEVISTAMEHLAQDPELFARRCPKQLALLIENLSELSK